MKVNRNAQVLAVARRRWQIEATMCRAWVKEHRPGVFAAIVREAKQKQAQMHPETTKLEEKNGK